jgi:hypothetical protein
MKRLGEILLERGTIAISELHTGLEACHYHGGRLGTHLLRLGFVDEQALLRALSEQLGVPPVASQVLLQAPQRFRTMIPPEVGRRIQAMVFDQRDGTLSVAMTSPRSPAAFEEVVNHVGLDIKPHIAAEPAILAALAQVEEEPVEAQPPEAPAGGTLPAISDEWQRLWTPRALKAGDLLHPRSRTVREEIPPAATFPGLAPVPAGGKSRSGPLEDEAFAVLLREAGHRDEIAELLLRRSLAIVNRCCLLAVHSGKVVGWSGRGRGIVVEDLQAFEVEHDMPSVLSSVGPGGCYTGPMPAGFVNQMILEIIGDPLPEEIAIATVTVKGRVVAYLIGDLPGSAMPPAAVEDLIVAAQKAGVALEILIMKKKFLS